MIQRIQTLWLLLAGLVNLGLFYFCIFKSHEIVNGIDTTTCLRINDRYPLMLIALVTIILPIAIIFMYKQRKRQRGMAFVAILANISFISAALLMVKNMAGTTTTPATGSYGAGAFLPVVAIIFLFMAMRGIVKDERLVKSTDRLR